jgi:retinaldehyde-binding protein 1
MFFHGGDMKKLHKFVPPEYLPKNYGGTNPELDYAGKDWYACVEKQKDFFALYNTFGFKE